jgi:hypothetical protein
VYVPLVLADNVNTLLVQFSGVISDVFVVCHYYVMLLWLYDTVVFCMVSSGT